jgi:hypothetical protein
MPPRRVPARPPGAHGRPRGNIDLDTGSQRTPDELDAARNASHRSAAFREELRGFDLVVLEAELSKRASPQQRAGELVEVRPSDPLRQELVASGTCLRKHSRQRNYDGAVRIRAHPPW